MRKIHRFSPTEIEVTRGGETQATIIEGYAAVYGARSELLSEGGKVFYETIRAGAFTNALDNIWNQRVDCVATYNHERRSLLARSQSGTLKLWEDADGLKFRFETPNTSVGRDVAEQVKRGDLRSCSFIAYSPQSGYTEARGEDGNISREITEFSELRDVSLVIDPAYPATYLEEVSRSISDFEDEESKALAEAKAIEDKKEADAKAIEDEKIERSLKHEADLKEMDEIINNLNIKVC
jgi:HK97 family phage prohead protease